MREIQAIMARQCFSLFALDQEVTLDVLQEASADLALPMASAHAPQWFAAAAEPEAPLIDQAPELQILPEEDVAGAEREDLSAKVADIDLVSMYAPELEREPQQAPPPQKPDRPADRRQDGTDPNDNSDASSAIRLLRELSGIDD